MSSGEEILHFGLALETHRRQDIGLVVRLAAGVLQAQSAGDLSILRFCVAVVDLRGQRSRRPWVLYPRLATGGPL